MPPAVVDQTARLLAHRLDLARDLALGDRIRVIYERSSGISGEVTRNALIYAEVDHEGRALRFYRDPERADEFLDDEGRSLSRYLLRTPLANPRVTSAFGMRMHPLLGFMRMHRGVDFGAPIGTPVLAAADGEVDEVRVAGGYGRLVRLRHAGGWGTGYAHLSAWAPGLHPGEQVRQGQVIGFVGSDGLSTGPHLHYEVYRAGVAVDPGSVTTFTADAARPTSPGFDAERLNIGRWLDQTGNAVRMTFASAGAQSRL